MISTYIKDNSKHHEYFDKNKHLIINTINDIYPIDEQSAAIICSPASYHLNDKNNVKKFSYICRETR